MSFTYQYKRLKDPSREIRLLRSSLGSQLKWETSVHILDRAPEYHAISYTWGEPEPLHTILLDDCPFHVRENCVTVLAQAHQHLGPDKYIWLDAVCIDQRNVDEKGPQVAMMGKVYATARSVLVSVGGEYDDSDLLYDTVTVAQAVSEKHRESLDKFALYISTCYRSNPDEDTRNYWRWVDDLNDEKYRRLVSAYSSFASRPYWRRLWVIRETSLTSRVDVACGRRLHRLEDIQYLCIFFRDVQRDAVGYFANKAPGRCSDLPPLSTDEDPLTSFGSCYAIRRNQVSLQDITFGLGVFLPKLVEYQCADPRDRIYGLLSLLEWGLSGPPPPDYRIEPLALGLDVMARVRSDEGTCKLRFPDDVCYLLAAIKATAASGDPASGNADSGHFTPSKDDCIPSTSTAVVPNECTCISSQIPQPSLIERETDYSCCRLCRGRPRMVHYDPTRHVMHCRG